jgi:D-amino peptidase
MMKSSSAQTSLSECKKKNLILTENRESQQRYPDSGSHMIPGFGVRLSLRQLLIMFLISCLIAVNPLTAQKKIYILTDLEGVSGVFKFKQTREKDTPQNIQACEYFMDDLAAVIKGLRDGGATEILVVDGHGNQCVIPHMMESGVKYVTGVPRPGAMWGLDESFDGMVQFGAHAMMGTEDGVLSHTQSSRSENRYWYNGIECGELVQCGLIAGYYDVPTILVTGDEATCREAEHFLDEYCVTVAVKDGIAREAAILYPFEETRKALYEGAKKSMEALSECKPYKMDMPIKGKLQYLDLRSNTKKAKIITREAVFEDARDIVKF